MDNDAGDDSLFAKRSASARDAKSTFDQPNDVITSACQERSLRLASASSANRSSRHSLRARLMLNIYSDVATVATRKAACNRRKEDTP
jgi:hypothetical protein